MFYKTHFLYGSLSLLIVFVPLKSGQVNLSLEIFCKILIKKAFKTSFNYFKRNFALRRKWWKGRRGGLLKEALETLFNERKRGRTPSWHSSPIFLAALRFYLQTRRECFHYIKESKLLEAPSAAELILTSQSPSVSYNCLI